MRFKDLRRKYNEEINENKRLMELIRNKTKVIDSLEESKLLGQVNNFEVTLKKWESYHNNNDNVYARFAYRDGDKICSNVKVINKRAFIQMDNEIREKILESVIKVLVYEVNEAIKREGC